MRTPEIDYDDHADRSALGDIDTAGHSWCDGCNTYLYTETDDHGDDLCRPCWRLRWPGVSFGETTLDD